MHEFIVQNNLQKFVNLTIEELDDEDIIQAIIKRKEELQENFKNKDLEFHNNLNLQRSEIDEYDHNTNKYFCKLNNIEDNCTVTKKREN